MLWDDHEVQNNWYPSSSGRARARPGETRVPRDNPIRVTSGPTSTIYRSFAYGPQLDVFGSTCAAIAGQIPKTVQQQAAAPPRSPPPSARLLKPPCNVHGGMKVIASGSAHRLIVPDGPKAFERCQQRWAAARREHEWRASPFHSTENIRNVVWVTGDVHYAAAHHYHPDRAQFKAFILFGSSSPGRFMQERSVQTLETRSVQSFGSARARRNAAKSTAKRGPSVLWVRPNRCPDYVMTVELRNLAGETLYTVDLDRKDESAAVHSQQSIVRSPQSRVQSRRVQSPESKVDESSVDESSVEEFKVKSPKSKSRSRKSTTTLDFGCGLWTSWTLDLDFGLWTSWLWDVATTGVPIRAAQILYKRLT